MQVQLVTQPGPYDCGAACLAMVLGLPVETMLDWHGHQPGMSSEDLDKYLQKAAAMFERQTYPTLREKSTYIVTVPSLNVMGGQHFIVIQTGAKEELSEGTYWFEPFRIFDPNRGREGRKIYGWDESERPFDCLISAWSEAVRIFSRETADIS